MDDKVLGLDVSTKSTGWFINKRSCGVVQPDPNLSFEAKLCYFRDELQKLLEKHKPKVVVIEDSYLRFENVQTLKQLARFSGVAMELATRLGSRVVLMTATNARKNCCGEQGKDFKKKEVFEFFRKKYKLDDWVFEKHNDITDAAALHWSFREKEKHLKKTDDNT